MFISKAEKFQLDFRITELEKIVVLLLRRQVDEEEPKVGRPITTGNDFKSVRRREYSRKYYERKKAEKKAQGVSK